MSIRRFRKDMRRTQRQVAAARSPACPNVIGQLVWFCSALLFLQLVCMSSTQAGESVAKALIKASDSDHQTGQQQATSAQISSSSKRNADEASDDIGRNSRTTTSEKATPSKATKTKGKSAEHKTDSSAQAERLNWLNASNNSSSGGKKCDYDKGQWQSCEPDGSQQKVMRLKAGDRTVCKPTKTIRRDCRSNGEIGCKYARGEWSSLCQDGQRVRIDTLVSLIDTDGNERDAADSSHLDANAEQAALSGDSNKPAVARCKPHRRITKDCGRTCHYVKSAWSECSADGFRTRVLTLEENKPDVALATRRQAPLTAAGDKREQVSAATVAAAPGKADTTPSTSSSGASPASKQRPKRAGDNQICARQKLIRRECRGHAGTKLGPGQQRQEQQQQQQPTNSQANLNSPTGAANMKQIQRRRLKQIQLKQTATAPAKATSAATTAAELATTTTVAPKAKSTGVATKPPPTTTTTNGSGAGGQK